MVEFLPLIDRGGWFTPPRDSWYRVATTILSPDGGGLTWPEEIGHGPNGARREAFPNGQS